ncbi:hypothetical protein KR200_006951, partial [Drosophila serrata]
VPDTCSLKDNCNLGDNLLTRSGQGSEPGDVAGDKLESKIASIFEDKVNYSLKLFADEATTTILEYQTANLSELHAVPGNFTLHQLHQLEAASAPEDDQIEEDEKVYLYNIGRRFLAITQPFDPARNPDASSLCRRQMRQYLDALDNFDLWALRMHDASGKLNSGILNGNINQPGDFDQCLGIQQRMKANQEEDNNQDQDQGQEDSIIRGQYCLAYAQPVLPHKSKRLQSFFKLIQSHGPFKSEFND